MASVTDTHQAKQSERGRPRSGTSDRPDLSAAEQILDAAAQLFAERGYAATSTRAIADLVGIRQASLYYHFPNKEQILRVLLMRTVEPSMRVAEQLASAVGDDPPARLWALVTFDTRQLFAAPHNIGALYFLPETRTPTFEGFRAERERLRQLYGSLINRSLRGTVAERAGSSREHLVDVVFGMVESVISLRADGRRDTAGTLVDIIGESCLRVLGHEDDDIVAIVPHGSRLLDLTAAR